MMDDLLFSKQLIDDMVARTIEAEEGCIKQVKELRTLAHELAHATARRLAITQTAVDAILSITSTGEIIGWNDAAEKMFGYSEEEILGKNISLIIPEKYCQDYMEGLKIVADGGEHHLVGKMSETVRVTKTGEEIPVELALSKWTTEKGIFFTGVIRDISERKRNEEKTASYVKQLEEALMRTVEAVTVISEMRDPYTTGHEKRVADIAMAIGQELGLNENTLAGLHVAGHLHDVGKMVVPSEILSKPGKLSPIEFQLIKQHAQSGHDVLKGIKFPWPVALVALQHHERMDGTGYPQGLKGEEIILDARIMAVADVVEAMSSHRPYRAGLGVESALLEIETGAGTKYDSNVATACLHLFREKGFVIPERNAGEIK